jgi:DMSO/TMAO reductase YedYZ heme-binding membrane subunit
MSILSRRWPLALAALIGVGALFLGLAQGTSQADSWNLAARYTARVGLPLFLLTYAASSLLRLAPSPSTKVLVRDRRWWGLAFAITHTIHFYALYMAVTTRGDSLTLLAPGAVAYGALLAMAVTSSDAAMKALGANWKRLHRTGIHVIWLVFTLAYAKRIPVEETMVTGLVGTTLCLLAAGLRFAAWRKTRRG